MGTARGLSGTSVSASTVSRATLFGPSAQPAKPLSKRELLVITTRLSIMLRSGVDLADAVHSVALRGGSESIEGAMRSVYSSLEGGQSLSQALEAEGQRFGGIVVASAAAGEASGKLAEVLERLIQILNNDLRLASSIRSLLSYPVVLTGVSLVVMLAMLFFVLPQFGSIYESSQAVVPLWTAVMLDVSHAARDYWWIMAVAMGATGGLIYRGILSPGGRQWLDGLVLHAPLLRSISVPLISGRIFRLQGMLLASGVAMIEVLRLTRQSTSNSCFIELCQQIESRVIQGVAAALRTCSFVPAEAAEMIATAEFSGQLGGVLQTLGEFYEGQGEQKLRDTVKIAEPAIIVIMGIFIGAMVLSVMLPLLDLSAGSGI
jgi:type II secretory pathway component PulF